MEVTFSFGAHLSLRKTGWGLPEALPASPPPLSVSNLTKDTDVEAWLPVSDLGSAISRCVLVGKRINRAGLPAVTAKPG